MTQTNEIKKVARIFEDLQTKADRTREDRRDEVYAKVPRIQEIDYTLSLTSIKILKQIQDKSSNAEQLIAELRENNELLLIEKNYLLNQNGFPTNYLEDIYECSACKDTGFIERKRCKCFEQKLIEILHSESQIERRTTKENFDTFSLDYYSNEKIGDTSPKQKMTAIHRQCLDFTNNFPTYKNFLFYGKPGVGKTFLCNCISYEIINKGNKVVYTMSNHLFNKFADLRFDKGDTTTNSEFYNSVYNADLLIIDDLGSEFITDLSKSELFNLINARGIAEKSTIISTNLTVGKINEIYTERVFSRIIESYTLCEFIGDDIRYVQKGLV